MANYHYVDAGTGSDSNGGTSWGDAWLTLEHAATTVNVAPSDMDIVNYRGAFTLSASLTAGIRRIYQPFVLLADSGASIAFATYSLWNSSQQSTYHIGGTWTGVPSNGLAPGVNSTFDSVNITGAVTSVSNNIRARWINCKFNNVGLTAAAGSYFQDCFFDHSSSGIVYPGGSDVTFAGCRFYNGNLQNAQASHHIIYNHCSFYYDVAPAYILGSSYEYWSWRMQDCVIHSDGVTSPFLRDLTAVAKRQLGWFTGNYSKGTITDNTNGDAFFEHEDFVTLTDDPFTDPANDDFTPSAELSAIRSTSTGKTPGAINAESSTAIPIARGQFGGMRG